MYDVIVVGAGPAGSTAARECANLGLSVLLLDKAQFPRDKPCGGGVSSRAADLLPFDLNPVVEQTIRSIYLALGSQPGFTRQSPQPLAYMTQRRHLDAFLVEKAMEKGVQFLEGRTVQEVDQGDNQVRVRAGQEWFRGRAVVAADGANGVTAKLAGLETSTWRLLALEGNITTPILWEDLILIGLGEVPGGYAWLFPKGDHINIGLIGWECLGPTLKDRLHDLVADYDYDPGELWGVKGHHLPVVRRGSTFFKANVVAVGDAAGLVDPLSGEGIFQAIDSGRRVARHLRSHLMGVPGYGLPQYEAGLGLGALTRGRQLHDLLQLSPRLAVCVARHTPFLWQYAVARLTTG